MRWSLHLAGAPVSLLVLHIPLLAGHHVIVPQRVGGWTGPYGDGILSIDFGLPMGLQSLTPSLFLFSYYPPSQRLPYSFTRCCGPFGTGSGFFAEDVRSQPGCQMLRVYIICAYGFSSLFLRASPPWVSVLLRNFLAALWLQWFADRTTAFSSSSCCLGDLPRGLRSFLGPPRPVASSYGGLGNPTASLPLSQPVEAVRPPRRCRGLPPLPTACAGPPVALW
eukprot:Gb_09126 [translate_table: standard]